jgi:hypothetical protein
MSEKPNPQLTEISAKLDRVAKLLAISLVKDLKTQKEQTAFLSDAGFQPKDIANILSTSSGTVRVALHAIRKERASKEAEAAPSEHPAEAIPGEIKNE